MLLEYINKAMSKAEYEKLTDGSYSGEIPDCPGTVAFAKTLYECERQLRLVVEGWLIVKIRHGDPLPVLDGLDLNKGIPNPKEIVAHG